MKVVFKIIVFMLLIFIFLENKEVEPVDFEAKNIQEFEEILAQKMIGLEEEFTIVYKGDSNHFKKEREDIIHQIANENPYTKGYFLQADIFYKFSIRKTIVRYEVKYKATREEREEADAMVKAVAKEIKKTNKTDFDKVKAVNDYIVKNTEYGFIDGKKEYTPYGVLINKKAVCDGYAIAAYQILKELGVEVQYVRGIAKEENHAWNKVKVDDEWYNLDITWNDPTPDKPNQSSYNYFLITDSTLAEDHQWDKEMYHISNDTKYDFFKNANYATKIDNEIYYSNAEDKGRLYKYNIATAENKKLSESRTMFIQSYEDELYYSDYSYGGYLTVADLNGKKKEVLAEELAENLYIEESVVYYEVEGVYKSIER